MIIIPFLQKKNTDNLNVVLIVGEGERLLMVLLFPPGIIGIFTIVCMHINCITYNLSVHITNRLQACNLLAMHINKL